MMKLVRLSLLIIVSLIVIVLASAYFLFSASLPSLDGSFDGLAVKAPVELSRDAQGSAIITAENMQDAAFALGYAHAQDRLFQMDLLRRNAAGELSALFGSIALENDKKHRFHQFRKRAKAIVANLPTEQQSIITSYTAGVNAYAESTRVSTFEYLITQTSFTPWLPEDTILATFSMYIDLQLGQVERDFNYTGIKYYAGQHVLDFFTQPSPFQATMDASQVPAVDIAIPDIRHLRMPETNISEDASAQQGATTFHRFAGNRYVTRKTLGFEEPKDIGSNNWAIHGALSTNKRGAILANDMHLGLNVPTLWYRAQLNYAYDDQSITATGVTLPGTPLIVVGATDNIAWGFTNSGIDNVDWVVLDNDSAITQVTETIEVKGQDPYEYSFPMSDIGPVRYLKDAPLALKWVAHQPYAVNVNMAWMPMQKSSDEALALARNVRIPTQNMVVADSQGNIAWQLTGATTSRTSAADTALSQSDYDAEKWREPEKSPAAVLNPTHGRVWSANARVVSAADNARYGNGGYALGARQKQIADSLMQTDVFDEQAFYELQLDNRAIYLAPWHDLLLTHLQTEADAYAEDIKHLQAWQACACSDSIGYTLVRKFRNELIAQLLEPLRISMAVHDISISGLWRSLEPSIWQILAQRPSSWLSEKHSSYDSLIRYSYDHAKDKLFHQYADGKANFSAITWGNVNALEITHPLANALGPLGKHLNMAKVKGFGDSYMPAVQSRRFGASQRLFAQPGNLENAILTIPGGQSMHPLSAFFTIGFDEYVNNQRLSLLPGAPQHSLLLTP